MWQTFLSTELPIDLFLLLVRDAVTELTLLRANQSSEMSPEEKQAFEQDPSFEKPVEEAIPYHSYEVQITSPSIGLELESTFQK